jgi:beta-N-acetylhexosaminidase
VISGLLKGGLGFGGLAMTDSLDMKAITSRLPEQMAAAAALKAGADVLLLGKGDFAATVAEIAAQVRSGAIPQARLDEAYAKVLAAKKTAAISSVTGTDSPFDKAYLDITRGLSREGLTLVKGGPLLPLPKDKKIAVIIFAPQRFAPNAISLYRALLQRGYSASQYFFGIGVSPADARKVRRAAAAADVLVIGSFQWTGVQNASQREAIRGLLATGKPAAVLSLMNPYDLPAYSGAACELALYGMTAPSMEAAGEALAGALTPAGRLPVDLSSAAFTGNGNRP